MPNGTPSPSTIDPEAHRSRQAKYVSAKRNYGLTEIRVWVPNNRAAINAIREAAKTLRIRAGLTLYD